MTFTQGPIPVAGHESLWRYVPLHTFFLHLQGKVFLPTIATLQACDIREGAQVFDHVVATVGFTDEEREQLREWVRNRRLSANDRELFDANRGFSRGNQEVCFKHYYQVLKRSRFAWCWFKSEHESAAMWGFYGNKGVAIRTRLRSLQQALLPSRRDWLVSEMKYINFQTLHPETFLESEEARQWVRRPFFLKGMEYVHESEVRLVTVAGERQQHGLELDGVNPCDWMDQVLFWPEMPASCIEALKAVVAKLQPKLKERLGASNLNKSGQMFEVEDSAKQIWDRIQEGSSDDEMQHWPELLKVP